jgi:hypothetical protein
MTLSPQEQEQLFERVRKRFPKWSKRKCSGYVHGVVDEAKFKRPHCTQTKAFSPRRSYAVGYVYGFVDARGTDAYDDPWLKNMKHRMSHTLEFQWWLDAS